MHHSYLIINPITVFYYILKAVLVNCGDYVFFSKKHNYHVLQLTVFLALPARVHVIAK